jgi:hypothetical protein
LCLDRSPKSSHDETRIIQRTAFFYLLVLASFDDSKEEGEMTNAAFGAVRKAALTTWEGIWYVLMCIPLGAGYFSKIPAKKALQDFGMVEMTSAERFWYVLMCIIPPGAAYFAKIPTAKALSELPQFRSQRQAGLGTLAQVQGQPIMPASPYNMPSQPIMPPSPYNVPPPPNFPPPPGVPPAN